MPFKLFTTLRYDPLLLKAHNNPSFTHAGWNYTHRSPCYMLDLHRDRILRAATYWHWAAVLPLLSGSPGLTTLETAIDAFLGSPCRGGDDARAYRLRVLVNEQAELKFEKADEAPRPLEALFPSALSAEKAGDGGPGRGPAFDVVLDREGTERSAYTHYKTTRRQMYDDARERAGLRVGEPKEVIIVNGADGSVMEGSVTTPYFLRGGTWVTPPVPSVFAEENGGAGQDGTTRRWALMNGLVVEKVVKADELNDGEAVWLSNGAKGFLFGIFKSG